MAIEAFDLAERFQTPVFVMTDLDLGMNNWMANAFEYPEQPISRGKVLTAEDLNKLAVSRATGTWTAMASAIARSPAPIIRPRPISRAAAATTTRPSTASAENDYIDNMDRLTHKFETMRPARPAPVVQIAEKAKIASSPWEPRITPCAKPATIEERLRYRRQLSALEAYPFTRTYRSSSPPRAVYVVDQNRDAQLLGLMRLELDADLIAKLRSVRYYGGLPLDARTVTEDVAGQEGNEHEGQPHRAGSHQL